jgi:hypothetical protein
VGRYGGPQREGGAARAGAPSRARCRGPLSRLDAAKAPSPILESGRFAPTQAVEALRRMRWEVTTPPGFEGLQLTPELRALVERVRPQPWFEFRASLRLRPRSQGHTGSTSQRQEGGARRVGCIGLTGVYTPRAVRVPARATLPTCTGVGVVWPGSQPTSQNACPPHTRKTLPWLQAIDLRAPESGHSLSCLLTPHQRCTLLLDVAGWIICPE